MQPRGNRCARRLQLRIAQRAGGILHSHRVRHRLRGPCEAAAQTVDALARRAGPGQQLLAVLRGDTVQRIAGRQRIGQQVAQRLLVDPRVQGRDLRRRPRAIGLQRELGRMAVGTPTALRDQIEVGMFEATTADQGHVLSAVDRAFQHMEMGVVERGIEQLAALHPALHQRHRVTTMRPQPLLVGRDPAHTIAPTFAAGVQAERHRVEEQPGQALGVRVLRPAIGDQAGGHIAQAGDNRQGLEMDRQ